MLATRLAALLFVLIGVAASANATPDGPVRITIECEDYGRTKACPAFLLGMVDANPVFLASPRATADVVLYVGITPIANDDRLHLRFVGHITGAPPVVEFDVDVDTRATDDAQLAQLQPAFTRGIALYVAAHHPELVAVTLAEPDGTTVAVPSTTPWDASLSMGGYGNWTDRYQSYNGWGTLSVSRTTRGSRLSSYINGNGGLSRSPPLVAPDGTSFSLDSHNWGVAAGLSAVHLLDPHWSIGAATSTWKNDPKGQYRYGADADVAVGWDKFAADDPRGNHLAVNYKVGYRTEGYNLRNDLGQLEAHYPTHALSASGTLRHDKVSYGVSLSAGGALLRADKRNFLSASPFVEWQLGAHVDLSLSLSVTKRAVPAPDPDTLDEADYELISRASYAEPISAYGSLNVTFHWDRSNGARNDRLNDL